jgi:hypothetical protein
MIERCYLAPGRFGRWVIVKAEDYRQAWSGSRWVLHDRGVPAAGVQVSNFASKDEAFNAAYDAGMDIASAGYLIFGGTITCFRCGMTSWNLHDREQCYCGACHQFHENLEAPQSIAKCGAKPLAGENFHITLLAPDDLSSDDFPTY